jgi:hypothetical protein
MTNATLMDGNDLLVQQSSLWESLISWLSGSVRYSPKKFPRGVQSDNMRLICSQRMLTKVLGGITNKAVHLL